MWILRLPMTKLNSIGFGYLSLFKGVRETVGYIHECSQILCPNRKEGNQVKKICLKS